MAESACSSNIRVCLLIENRLLRESLARILRKREDLVVVSSDGKANCLPPRTSETEYDVLILDFFDLEWLQRNVSSGKSDLSRPKLLLIAMTDGFEQFLSAVRGGVSGYLLKDASIEEIVEAVRLTSRGEAVCPPTLCSSLLRYVCKNATGLSAKSPVGQPLLTLRQRQLTALVAKGLTNKEIAARLNLSEYTVRNHIHRIMKLVDARSRGQAVQTILSSGYSEGGSHVSDGQALCFDGTSCKEVT
jgi:DNA-binding NarL/FixJ family response regulator